MKRLLHIFVGHGKHVQKSRPAIKNQVYTVLRIWRNYDHLDFGIERIFRLFLALIQFISLSLYIKQVTGYFGSTAKKIGIEIYVLLKLAFPLLAMSQGWTQHGCFMIVVTYFVCETLIYLLSIIFVSDATRDFIQPRRSFLLLFLNFLEITFAFASIYNGISLNNLESFNRPLASTTDAIYFSVVTATTTGFGDFYPVFHFNKWLVIIQSGITFLFVALFINYFSFLLQYSSGARVKQNFTMSKHRRQK